jgi:two-component system response regulator PilR (NtrC family)
MLRGRPTREAFDAGVTEDSVRPQRASNSQVRPAWRKLGDALRVLADAGPAAGGELLQALLQLVLEATGAERAFLVLAAPREPHGYRLGAARSVRDDAAPAPSRSATRRALAGARPLFYLDAARDLPVSESSVRELALHTILSVPVPASRRAALLLDSRTPAPLAAPDLREVLEAFAALVGLALRGGQRAERGALATDTSAGAGDDYPSAAWSRLEAWIDRVAATELPVLVLGESGSGKERVAREIHLRGCRSGGPFVAVNCCALTETLLEAELFGAERGAYTGADRDRPGLFRLAHGGTLFLDEVGDMPLAMQAKLLRVIEQRRVRPVGAREEQDVDVRIVSASHLDPADGVRTGSFRADLLYRLAVLQIDVPPLRERRADLPRLVEQLGGRLCRETGLGPPRIGPDGWRSLEEHDWPGNVRELHAVLARALLRSAGGEIGARHIGPLVRREPVPRFVPHPQPGPEHPLERSMIEAALAQSEGNVTAAARRIGWSKQKLYRRMKALALTR